MNALQKMRAVGHLEITGTLGNDCSYIRMTQTPTGRKIVFATSRQIRMAEAWTDSNSMSYDLTAGVLEINDQDKSKSTGALYPAAQLVLDKEGELIWTCCRIRGACPPCWTGKERQASILQQPDSTSPRQVNHGCCSRMSYHPGHDAGKCIHPELPLCFRQDKDVVNGKAQQQRSNQQQCNPHSAGLETLADGNQQSTVARVTVARTYWSAISRPCVPRSNTSVA